MRDKIPSAEYLKTLHVKSAGAFKVYYEYVHKTLKNIVPFENVYNQTELEKVILNEGIADKVKSISDYIGLYNLQKEMGDFLISESGFRYLYFSRCVFEIKVIESATANVIYHVKREGLSSTRMERAIFNPVFNDYIRGLSENEKSL